MSHTRGKPLSSEVKKLIVSVKQYFDRNKADFRQTELSAEPLIDGVLLLAKEHGLSTLKKKIMLLLQDNAI